MTTEQKLIWLDCDPGHDDFFAILLAAMDPASRLIGISTGGGNQSLTRVTKNALDALYLLDLGTSVPCVAGQEHPLMHRIEHCPEIHGESGLETSGDIHIPAHDLQPVKGKAIEVMACTILAQTVPVRLVATGKMTNVALLLQVYPEVMRNLHSITIMGGASTGGNTHPVAEFNIQNDPEACQILFNFAHSFEAHAEQQARLHEIKEDYDLRVPVVMVPLEVTHTVLVTDEILKRIEQLRLEAIAANEPSLFYQLSRSLLLFFAKTYREVFEFHNGPPLHDPVAIFYALYPEQFKSRFLRVDVECAPSHSRGQTVVDIWKQTGRPANVTVTTAVDVNKFWDHMLSAIAQVAKLGVLDRNQPKKVE